VAYLSLYRKWRPQSFDDVVGQEHVVRTLKNALDSGRTTHAYIFSGPRGTGKTTLARLLAKGLNCEQGPTGSWCNQCDSCVRIARGQAVDVIEIDGASNRGIDEIRDVREKVKFAPAQGRYKVYIIDEVHMLTVEAFNALLKVLEEPPRHVVFVFATTEPHKIPATIVSRCQKFDFRAFTPGEIAEQVRRIASHEGVSIDDGALRLIAGHSAGGMRDALGFLDQCIAFANGEVTESLAAQVLGVVERDRLEALAEAIAGEDLAACLRTVKSVVDSGRDLRQFASDLVQFFRDLMILRAAPASEGLVMLSESERSRALELAGRFSVGALLYIVEKLGKAESDMRWATTAQLPLEMALIEIVRSRRAPTLEEIAERLERLERREAQAPAASAAAGIAKEPTTAPAAPAPARAGTGSAGDPAPGATPVAASREPQPAAERPLVAASSPAASQAAASREGRPQAPGGQRVQGAPDDLLERVVQAWPELLESLRAARNVQQEAFLREGRPGAVEGDNTVVIYFSPTHRFHQANIANEKNRLIVEKAMTKLLGREVRVKAVLGEPPPIRPAPTGGAQAAGAAGVPGTAGERGTPAARGESAGTGSAGTPGRSGPAARSQGAGRDGFDDAVDGKGSGALELNPDEIDEPILKAALKLFGGTITKLERREAEDR